MRQGATVVELLQGVATMAERVGFEPTRRLPAYGISSAAPSTGLGDLSDARKSTAAVRRRPNPLGRHARGRQASTSSPSCAHRVWKLPGRSTLRYVWAPK